MWRFLLAVIVIDSPLFAQETISFSEAVERSVDERVRLQAFDCNFPIDYNYNSVTNQIPPVRVSGRTQSKGRIVFDELSEFLMVAMQQELIDYEVDPNTSEKDYVVSFDDGINLKILAGELETVWSQSSNLRRSGLNSSATANYTSLPFYLHGFGLAGQAEFKNSSRFPLDVVARDLLALLPDKNESVDANGVASFDFSSIQMDFDTTKGYWPIYQVYWTSKRKRKFGDVVQAIEAESDREYVKRFETKLDLIEVDNSWVPRKATVISQTDTRVYEFSWNSVNQTIDPSDFKVDDVIAGLISNGLPEVDIESEK